MNEDRLVKLFFFLDFVVVKQMEQVKKRRYLKKNYKTFFRKTHTHTKCKQHKGN